MPRNAEYSKNPEKTLVVDDRIRLQIEKNTLSEDQMYGPAIIGGNN